MKRHLHWMAGVFALGLVVCLASAPAQAQDSKIDVFGGYSYGVSSSNNCYFYCGSSLGLHGYSAAVTYNFNKNIGLEANFSGHNGTTTVYTQAVTSTNNGDNEVTGNDLYSYTFGPKLTLPAGNFSLFTHFLVGAARVHESYNETCIQSTGAGSCNTPNSGISHGTGMAFKTGGGVDWNHGRWGIRILEVDYVRNSVSTTSTETCSYCSSGAYTYTNGMNNFEMSTGVIFHFGKR
ncbi:MAG TPA: outer membrane beta-barrel protein [Candidatus Dormibacteraeota bacterium]|nr:outer membrane beta-barrel protein [Candidatus Dormibacteraeota bacterium]